MKYEQAQPACAPIAAERWLLFAEWIMEALDKLLKTVW
jgi:hypothetical protein